MIGMNGMSMRLHMLISGRVGDELLDRPANNFDVAGVPRGAWSSHLLACYENCVPSCLMSFARSRTGVFATPR